MAIPISATMIIHRQRDRFSLSRRFLTIVRSWGIFPPVHWTRFVCCCCSSQFQTNDQFCVQNKNASTRLGRTCLLWDRHFWGKGSVQVRIKCNHAGFLSSNRTQKSCSLCTFFSDLNTSLLSTIQRSVANPSKMKNFFDLVSRQVQLTKTNQLLFSHRTLILDKVPLSKTGFCYLLK